MRWILAISSDDDGAWLSYFNGTECEVKNVLMHFVDEDRENECGFRFGTDSIDDICCGDTGMVAYNCFEDYTTHYVAKRADKIKTYIEDDIYI